jgi:hypothetical protein
MLGTDIKDEYFFKWTDQVNKKKWHFVLIWTFELFAGCLLIQKTLLSANCFSFLYKDWIMSFTIFFM